MEEEYRKGQKMEQEVNKERIKKQKEKFDFQQK